MKEIRIEEKLGLLTYKSDKQSHIKILDSNVCVKECFHKPCTFICPAKVYEWDESKKIIVVGFENCIECGACRMLCPFNNIYCYWPRGGFGVQYKYG